MTQPGLERRPAMGILGLPEEAHHLIAVGLEIGDRWVRTRSPSPPPLAPRP